MSLLAMPFPCASGMTASRLIQPFLPSSLTSETPTRVSCSNAPMNNSGLAFLCVLRALRLSRPLDRHGRPDDSQTLTIESSSLSLKGLTTTNVSTLLIWAPWDCSNAKRQSLDLTLWLVLWAAQRWHCQGACSDPWLPDFSRWRNLAFSISLERPLVLRV